MGKLAEKTAIVTGGASGIGRAVSEALGKQGAVVTVADLDGAGADAVARGIRDRGGRAQARALDVRDAAAVQKLVDDAAAEHGRLDYMFNNAGIGIGGEERHVSLDDWNRVLDVNLRGVVHGVHAAYALMVRQGSGHIVNTASLAGLVAAPGAASYCAAKFGVVGLSRALRAEGAGLGVRVSVVCPGFIDTPIFTTSTIRGVADRARLLAMAPRGMPPERCARIILEGVTKNRAVIVVTWQAKALWWFDRFSPDASIWLWTQIGARFRKAAEGG